MLILSVNKILKWCQITNGWGTYTCPTKEVNGELFFKFKEVWHPVIEYISDYTDELIEENGRIFSRPFQK